MIFLWQLENIRTPFFNEIMQFVTYFGQELLIIAVICALYWCADSALLILWALLISQQDSVCRR